jgi:hypothetical protein
VKVAVASAPNGDSDDPRGALAHELDLAKAALLYADEVEIVSLSVAMIDGLRVVTQEGSNGMLDLLGSLDSDVIAHLGGSGLPADWQTQVRQMMSLDPETVATVDPAAATSLREMQAELSVMSDRARSDMAGLLETMGATELAPAIDAGVLKVADLAAPSTTLRPAELGGNTELDAQMWNWIGVLSNRLEDRRVRVLFDEQVGTLIQHAIDEGVVEASEQNLRLAAQASLGSGFISRLPAFPQARMDELLDLRRDLAPSLTRYRSAVHKFSRDVPGQVGSNLEFEIQELWDSTVVPQLAELEELLIQHSFVRELFRAAKAQDIADFGAWTAGTAVVMQQGAELGVIGTGLVAAGVNGAGRAGQAALDAFRERASRRAEVASHDLYLLYKANKRLDDLRT